MKSVAVICEFNPLHNGHIHFLNEVIKNSKKDILCVIMSGSVSMRGDIAPIDKLTKTKMALDFGIDLVVELPFVFATQNSDIFALKAIEIINELEIDELYFGSESNDMPMLYAASKLIDDISFNNDIKVLMNSGISYKKATSICFEARGFHLSSNDILGLSYIHSLIKTNSKCKPNIIKRISSSYLDKEATDLNIASATAVRLMSQIKNYVPSIVNNHFLAHGFNHWDNYFDSLKYKLISSTLDDLHKYFGVKEGIENAIKKGNYTNFDSLVTSLSSKRYTNSRIKRILCYILFNIYDIDISKHVPYIRILGMNKNGQGFLNFIKKKINIPLISNITTPIDPFLEIELRVSKIYSLKYFENIYIKELKGPIIKE